VHRSFALPAEFEWITGIMRSTPTGIAAQLAAAALFSDNRPEAEKLRSSVAKQPSDPRVALRASDDIYKARRMRVG
jgi:hypothetical protein